MSSVLKKADKLNLSLSLSWCSQVTSFILSQCWPRSMLVYCQLTLRNKLQWNFNKNLNTFIRENAFENVVCEMGPFCLGLNVLVIQHWLRWWFGTICQLTITWASVNQVSWYVASSGSNEFIICMVSPEHCLFSTRSADALAPCVIRNQPAWFWHISLAGCLSSVCEC